MKRKLTFISTAFLLSAAFTLMSCGNDDEINNTAFITSDGKVDVARAVEFRVNFDDYNSEEELQGTRAAKTERSDTLSRQYVELDNGLLAEVTVQRDTAKTQTSEQRPMTRTLDDDTYTMLAYKDGVLKGEMTGVVSSGRFTATGSNGYINLATGTYDFVLFNSKVTRNGDNLTVSRDNVDKALIGRTQYKVESKKNQTVTFTMNHAGSRLRIKLTGYMPLTASATLSSVDASSVPYTATYNAATDTWSNSTGAATIGNLTFPSSKETLYTSETYTSQSNEYMYFLPSTNPSKLKLKFISGTIYNLSMANAELNLSVPTLASMAANGSYIINVKLMYNFLYLMSDGTTGFISTTTYGGGSKTPIGVVVSRSNRLAVALKDANNGNKVQWYKTNISKQQNYRQIHANSEVDSYRDMDGYRYTWQADGSADGTTIKANEQTDYPAFYYAGHYGEELSAELAAQGKELSDGMETKKWHLPSTGEWKYVFTALGFGNGVALLQYSKYYNWYGNLADVAFTQVGGTTLSLFYKWYWSSSEFSHVYAGLVFLNQGLVYWNKTLKENSFSPVRAFVAY